MIRAALLAATVPVAAMACEPIPPVDALAFQSRYADGDASRSVLDPARAAAAKAAVAELDAFVSEVTRGLNTPEGAACAVARLAAWARADALSELGSETARLTVGARLAGMALALRQAAPLAGDDTAAAEVATWLGRRLAEQRRFWARDAPRGAARGNLRAWAALAAAATADTSGDRSLAAWATWSMQHVLCTAGPDGALPQEMRRGPRALHYQLHAVAPLVTGAAVLRDQGIDLARRCDGALDRVVGYALSEIASDGARTVARTGEAQTLLADDAIPPHMLAWLEPWLAMRDDPRAETLAAPLRPLRYSKLGGDVTAQWGKP